MHLPKDIDFVVEGMEYIYDELFEFIYKKPTAKCLYGPDFVSVTVQMQRLEEAHKGDKWDIKVMTMESVSTTNTILYLTPPKCDLTLTLCWNCVPEESAYFYSGVQAFAFANDIKVIGNIPSNFGEKWTAMAALPWISKNQKHELMAELVRYAITNDCIVDLLDTCDKTNNMETKVEILHMHNKLAKRKEGR